MDKSIFFRRAQITLAFLAVTIFIFLIYKDEPLIIKLMLITFERLSIIVTIAFIMTRFKFFRTLLESDEKKPSISQTFKLLLVFAFLGFMANFSGIVIDVSDRSSDLYAHRIYNQLYSGDGLNIRLSENEAIINFRSMVLVISGLLGGLPVSLLTALIVGLHRFGMGGYSDQYFIYSSLLTGLLSGLIHYWPKLKVRYFPSLAAIFALIIEIIRITFIYNLNDDGQELAKMIAVPMIVGNVFGCFILMSAIQIVDNERKHEKEKAKRKSAEIQSLLLYMIPHFLISTMSVIKSNIPAHTNYAKQLIGYFSKYIRESLVLINKWNKQESTTIQDEVGHVSKYIAIMKGHYPKIQFLENYDSTLNSYKCPPFVLQPLVENAIHYGCKYKTQEDIISVNVSEKNNYICLSIGDNGGGVDDQIVEILGKKPVTTSSFGTGSAFYNIIQRLKKTFGKEYYYHITSNHTSGTLIQIFIPKEGN